MSESYDELLIRLRKDLQQEPVDLAVSTQQALVPPGAVIQWPHSGVPAGYLAYNGATLPRVVYPALSLLYSGGGTTFTIGTSAGYIIKI